MGRPPGPRAKGLRPERELRNAIIALLRAHGIAAWPTGVGAFKASYGGKERFVRMGVPGMSDVIGIMKRPCPMPQCPYEDHRRGQFVAIEVKSPGGRVSPEQTAFLQNVVRAGGIGFVAHSCQDVIDKLDIS